MDVATFPFRRACPFDIAEDYAVLRRERPVAPVTLPTGATAWLVTSYADVRTVLTDPRFDQGHTGPPPGEESLGSSIADPAHHARWRGLVNKVFSLRQAESVRARIGALAERTLDELDAPADLMAGYAFRLSIRAMCASLDVPDDLWPAFEAWADSLHAVTPSFESFTASLRALDDAVAETVARADPDGVLASVAELSDEDRRATVQLMLIAGHESTAVQFGNGVYALFAHPDQLAALRRDPALIGPAVEEILRYALVGTGFTGSRRATAEVRLGGVTVPAGATVLVSLDSAGRDEARVAGPETFDITRGAPGDHLAFGAGPHFCLGAPLARVALREGLGRLLRRFPDLRPAGPLDEVEFTSNRFNHYSRELRVVW